MTLQTQVIQVSTKVNTSIVPILLQIKSVRARTDPSFTDLTVNKQEGIRLSYTPIVIIFADKLSARFIISLMSNYVKKNNE